MDILNALVAILNFVVIPAAAYGAQLALGALGVTLGHASGLSFGGTVVLGVMAQVHLTDLLAITITLSLQTSILLKIRSF